MFYLLEDNTIIDSNSKEDIELLKKNRRFIENGKIVYFSGNFLKCKKCANCHHWKCYECQFAKKFDEEIKKQSENVFDLIEKGDLVKCFNNIYEIKNVYYIDDGVVGFITSNCGICFPSWTNFLKGFNAIYKPNANGDYIKVWERKED